MRRRAYVGIAALVAVILCAAVLIHIVRAQTFMTEVGRMAESLMAQKLGTTVHIGSVEIRSLHELKLDDIVIYDKQRFVCFRCFLHRKPRLMKFHLRVHMRILCGVRTVHGTTGILAQMIRRRVRSRGVFVSPMRRRRSIAMAYGMNWTGLRERSMWIAVMYPMISRVHLWTFPCVCAAPMSEGRRSSICRPMLRK